MSEQTIQAIYYEGVSHPEIPGEISLHEGQKIAFPSLPNTKPYAVSISEKALDNMRYLISYV